MKSKHKDDKSIWQPEVEVLKALKKQLTDLTISETKGKGKEKSPAKVNGADAANVAALEELIAKQVIRIFD